CLRVEPCRQRLSLHVIHGHVKRRLVEINVVNSDDIRVVPGVLAQHAEERDLALERSHPVRTETEFKNAPFLQDGMPREPHLAEPTLAKGSLQFPTRPGNFAPHRGTPAKAESALRSRKPARLLRMRRRLERRVPGTPNFANLQRLIS